MMLMPDIVGVSRARLANVTWMYPPAPASCAISFFCRALCTHKYMQACEFFTPSLPKG